MESRCCVSVIIAFIKRNAWLLAFFSSALFQTLYREIKATTKYLTAKTVL